jgi:hypothetical protein
MVPGSRGQPPPGWLIPAKGHSSAASSRVRSTSSARQRVVPTARTRAAPRGLPRFVFFLFLGGPMAKTGLISSRDVPRLTGTRPGAELRHRARRVPAFLKFQNRATAGRPLHKPARTRFRSPSPRLEHSVRFRHRKDTAGSWRRHGRGAESGKNAIGGSSGALAGGASRCACWSA